MLDTDISIRCRIFGIRQIRLGRANLSLKTKILFILTTRIWRQRIPPLAGVIATVE